MTTNIEAPAGGVVVHLDEADPAKHESVLTNIANLRDELGDTTPIELVVHGPGLAAALAGGPVAEHLNRLINQGIEVAACANTLRAKNLSPDRLVVGVRVVPAGIAELVRRQRAGWAYVRP